MCITTGPAHLSNTRIFAGASKIDNKIIHTLSYQNMVQNLSSGSNCMLLHFPASEEMTKDNIVDMEGYENFLKDVDAEYKRDSMTKGISRSIGVASLGFNKPVHRFDHGIYTILLSQSLAGIKKAVKDLPENKRPTISLDLLMFYQKTFKDWTYALCCFDNNDVRKSTPLFWWYVPKNPDVLFAPMLDSHTGDAPNLTKNVDEDHTVTFGVLGELNNFNSSGFFDNGSLDIPRINIKNNLQRVSSSFKKKYERLNKFLPDDIYSSDYHGSGKNGDLYFNYNKDYRPQKGLNLL